MWERKEVPLLTRAINIAVAAHGGTLDRGGALYILHPLRVMLSGENEDEMIVGVLHDTVEDTYVTLETLRFAGFSKEIVAAVDAVSRRKTETYRQYIQRIVDAGTLAIKVKLFDIADNCDPKRMSGLPPDEATGMMKRYSDATWTLGMALSKARGLEERGTDTAVS